MKKTALERFIAGLQRMVSATPERLREDPTVKDSAQAIKEHAALVAVAEAAKELRLYASAFADRQDRIGKGSVTARSHVSDFDAALANLAAARKGKA